MPRTITTLVLLFAMSSAISAQEPGVAKEQTFGDWTIYEFRDFDQDPAPPPKGVADMAKTPALDASGVDLEVHCGRYDVGYSLSEDRAYRKVPNPDGNDGYNIELTYTKTNKEEYFQQSLSWGGYSGRGFDMHTESLIKAGTVMICPTKDDKDVACLTFSLKGFTAALKAICPKR